MLANRWVGNRIGVGRPDGHSVDGEAELGKRVEWRVNSLLAGSRVMRAQAVTGCVAFRHFAYPGLR